jgi:DNA polymerase-3 subunit epsilon
MNVNSSDITRQIVLDTETTGMNMTGVHYEGHRIIEIGAVEIINRRLTGNHFHVYIKPDRLVDPEAFAVHGISDEFLADKPEFKDIYQDFFNFINGAELVIHNASFDVGFIDHEFRLMKQNLAKVETFCTVTDTLAMARRLFPGKRNNLDILCDRYHIDNSRRTLHGALLDAEILAEVYLAMTGGQTSIAFSLDNETTSNVNSGEIQRLSRTDSGLKIVYASDSEIMEHEKRLDIVAKKGDCLWRA